MEYRPLGRTGVHVSKLCLGTMMFGAWGNTDHDDSIRIIHRALDAGINFVDTADVYSAGESEEIVGKALKGRRDDVVLATKFWRADGRGPQPPRRLAPLDHRRSRELAAAPGHRLDRPLPAAPPRPAHRHRRDPRRPHRPRPAGQGPLHRLVLVLRRPDRRGAVDGARAAPRALPHRAAAVLDPRPRHRARRAPHRPTARHGHPHLQPAGRRLAVRKLERRQLTDLAGAAAAGRPLRHVAAREPAQARSRRTTREDSPTTPACRSSSSRSPSSSTTPP